MFILIGQVIGRSSLKSGNLIYDHEYESYGLIIETKKIKNVAATFDHIKILYPRGVDIIEIPEDDMSIEVLNASR